MKHIIWIVVGTLSLHFGNAKGEDIAIPTDAPSISTPIPAAEDMLIGSWEGGDTAAMSIYGTVNISKKYISWRKNHNFSSNCKLAYEIQKEDFGVTFKDQGGHTYVTEPDSKFTTFLLKINSNNCATRLTHFRLTFQLENNYNYLAMVEYESSNPVGWMHFSRQINSPK